MNPSLSLSARRKSLLQTSSLSVAIVNTFFRFCFFFYWKIMDFQHCVYNVVTGTTFSLPLFTLCVSLFIEFPWISFCYQWCCQWSNQNVVSFSSHFFLLTFSLVSCYSQTEVVFCCTILTSFTVHYKWVVNENSTNVTTFFSEKTDFNKYIQCSKSSKYLRLTYSPCCPQPEWCTTERGRVTIPRAGSKPKLHNPLRRTSPEPDEVPWFSVQDLIGCVISHEYVTNKKTTLRCNWMIERFCDSTWAQMSEQEHQILELGQ